MNGTRNLDSPRLDCDNDFCTVVPVERMNPLAAPMQLNVTRTNEHLGIFVLLYWFGLSFTILIVRAEMK
jgi:hypothetical protein